MARFDIYRNEGGSGYLLDVQTDLLGRLNTRMVVPLLPLGESIKPAKRLNPVVEVEGNKVVMATQFMAAVPDSELRLAIINIGDRQHEISTALDMLFLGF